MGPWAAAGLGMLGGAVLPGLFGRGGGNKASEAGQEYLRYIPQHGHQAYDPFIQQGQQVFKGLPNYQQMAQNPVEHLNQLLAQYQPSTGYQYRHANAMRGASASAAAGGVAGTPDDQRARAELVNGLMADDQQQFLKNIFDVQGFGTNGLEHQVDRGFQASGDLANYLGGNLGQQGQLAFQGRNQQQANKYGLINQLLGAGAGAFGAYQGAQGMQNFGQGMNGGGGFNPLNGINRGAYHNPAYGLGGA